MSEFRKKRPQAHVNHERWMVSWADFMTLLFALFVLLFAISNVDQQKLHQVADSVEEAFGVLPSQAEGVLEKQYPQSDSIIPPIIRTYKEYGKNATEAKAKVEAKLQQVLNENKQLKNTLKARWEERGLVIQFSDSVLFESGSAQLKPSSLPVLKAAIQTFLLDLDNPIRIEGHTDNQPYAYRGNWELSAARATSVLKYILSTGWLQPNRLSMAGYGEYKPIATNETPEGRARNRRVDIVILNQAAQTNEPLASNRMEQAVLEEQLRYKMENRR